MTIVNVVIARFVCPEFCSAYEFIRRLQATFLPSIKAQPFKTFLESGHSAELRRCSEMFLLAGFAQFRLDPRVGQLKSIAQPDGGLPA
jgi:hypothetical protein